MGAARSAAGETTGGRQGRQGRQGRGIPIAASSTSTSPSDGERQPSLFPSARQTRIPLPCLLLSVTTSDVAGLFASSSLSSSSSPSESLLAGVDGVVLVEGGGGDLYGAGVTVREGLNSLNTGKLMLVGERADVAGGVGADGVVLGRGGGGLPVVGAKGWGGGGMVVGKVVDSREGERAAAEGAGVLFVEMGEGNGNGKGDSKGGPSMSLEDLVRGVRDTQISGSSVPVVGILPRSDGDGSIASLRDVELARGLDGLVVPFREGLTGGELAALRGRLEALQQQEQRDEEEEQQQRGGTDDITTEDATRASATDAGAGADATQATDAIADVLSTERERLIMRQKTFLQSLIDFLALATPSLEEVSLLRDSLKQLDELFLVVIVGEFNSGKSAVVNAMLGNSVVPEGILPTTNEITVIKYAERGEERVEQDVDGLFVRYTAAELLKEINIVDTPGTNVILERQQRLTEEFIPRADLVLFVLSADRYVVVLGKGWKGGTAAATVASRLAHRASRSLSNAHHYHYSYSYSYAYYSTGPLRTLRSSSSSTCGSGGRRSSLS